MTYIVNPIHIYLLEVADALKTTFMTFGGILLAATVALIIIRFADTGFGDYDSDDNEIIAINKALKKTAPAGIILLSIGLLIPNRETVIGMMVANVATVENGKLTVEALKSAVDYVVQAISSLK